MSRAFGKPHNNTLMRWGRYEAIFLTPGIDHSVGADFAMVALLSLSAVAATCAVCASASRPGPRGPGAGGVRAALTQGMRAAAAGALFALPLCYAYSIVSRRPVGATPSLAQIGFALVPLSVFFSQFVQSCLRPYGRTQRRIVIIGDPAARSRIASQREIAHDIVGFFELSSEDPLAGGCPQPAAESASRLQRFLEKAKPDEVVVACADRQGDVDHAADLPVWELLRVKANGLRVVNFAGFWERETGRIDLQSLHPEWLLFGPQFSRSARFLFCKRLSDAYASESADDLARESFSSVLQNLWSSVDVVLIDAPPFMALSSASVLAAKADVTIVVAAWSTTPREVVRYTVEQIQRVAPRIAGVVLNKVDIGKNSKYDYGDAKLFTGDSHKYYVS